MRKIPLITLALFACRVEDKTPTESQPAESTPLAVDEDGDGVPAEEDCDDSNAAAYPGAAELCDSVDNDCDGEVDNEAADAQTWYADADGDGVGTDAYTTSACAQPTGYAAAGGDCDDGDAAIYPGAPEDDCQDPTDYNCDGSVGFADGDGDGYAACEECDDTNRAVNPSATEVCDGLDNDCDGEADVGARDADTWYQDTDGDGWGDADYSTESCSEPAGYAAQAGDCATEDPAVNPDAAEVCDGLDNDCDGETDPASAADAATWYLDADEDGYGNSKRSTTACEAPSGYVDNSGDCDDTEPLAWTGAGESCDGVDNDCDGDVDEDVLTTWYLDADGDGYGGASGVQDCAAPTSAYTATGGDCDDGSDAVYPGATPACDGSDADCDGLMDNDADGDGYADASCGGEDCDDSDASVLPELGGGCALGTTCLDVLNNLGSASDGTYTIDPDGFGAGLDPFDVYCDMSTDGGGWTEVAYAADLTFKRWHTSGDIRSWLTSDFSLELSDDQIAAIQALSSEGSQTYQGLCEHVIHYYYTAGSTYSYSFGFRFFDGTETTYGASSWGGYDITVSSDGCKGNGGEGGAASKATYFVINSPLVPVVNVNCLDCGDGSEYFGSQLTSYPAWLR